MRVDTVLGLFDVPFNSSKKIEVVVNARWRHELRLLYKLSLVSLT
jgi:hypothetical protein